MLAGVYLPYLFPVALPTDVKPLALISASIMLLLRPPFRGIPPAIMLLGVMLLYAVLVGIVESLASGTLTLATIRSVGGYLSVFAIASAVYQFRGAPLLTSTRALDAATALWAGGALIQLLIGRDALTFMFPESRTTIDRGLTSLALEPTFYGSVALCLFFLYFIQGKEKSIGAMVNVVQVILLARSVTAMLPLGAAVMIYLIREIRFKRLLTFGFATAASLLVVQAMSERIDFARLLRLSELALAPDQLIAEDHSTNVRFYHIALSLKGSLTNYGLPHGFNAWEDYYQTEYVDVDYQWRGVRYAYDYSRVGSGLGSAMFELGAIGVLLPLAIIKALQYRFGSVLGARPLAIGIGLMALFAQSLPLAFPLYGYTLGFIHMNRYGGERPLRRSPYRSHVVRIPPSA